MLSTDRNDVCFFVRFSPVLLSADTIHLYFVTPKNHCSSRQLTFIDVLLTVLPKEFALTTRKSRRAPRTENYAMSRSLLGHYNAWWTKRKIPPNFGKRRASSMIIEEAGPHVVVGRDFHFTPARVETLTEAGDPGVALYQGCKALS